MKRTEASDLVPERRRSDASDRLPWLGAIVMIGAAAMDLIDLSVVNVALPTIRGDLGASTTQLQWVVSAYMLAFAAVLIVAGSFGDLWGRKCMFCGGVAMFGVTSLVAGLAPSAEILIAARWGQGLAAGVMIPQVLGTIRAAFPAAERGKVFGIYGGVLAFSSAFGLILGGVVIHADLFGSSWRPIFLLNVPVAIVGLALSMRAVPETAEVSAKRPDLWGAALLAVAILAITYPLVEGRSLGWPTWGWLVLGAGVAGLVLLGIRAEVSQLPGVAPLLTPRLVRVPAFTLGLLVQAAFAAGLQGFSLVFVVWLQTGMEFSALGTGLTMLGMSVGSFILAAVAGPMAQRWGRIVLCCGGLVLGAGVLLVEAGTSHVDGTSDGWPLLPGLILLGAGLSLLAIPLVTVVLAAVPRQIAGGAGGVFSTAQQLGGALGVAGVAAIFFAHVEVGHSLTTAFRASVPLMLALFGISAILSLALPGTAVTDDDAAWG